MPITKKKIKILDCYEQVFNDQECEIYLLWGGRDKGASYLVSQRLVIDMMNDPYLRGVFVRKVGDTIKESQYQTTIDAIESYGFNSAFRWIKSPLEIYCTKNGNKVIARGCDDMGKIKSLRGYNWAHVEEANQITEDDFAVLYTTLRHESPDVRIRIYLTFNSDFPGDYKDHFIWKYYLSRMDDPYINGIYSSMVDVPLPNGDIEQVEVKFFSHHGTYKQNPYCPPQRAAIYEGYKDKSTYYYNVYAKGLLGKRENDNPFIWALNRNTHYSPQVKPANINYPLILSFDFNHDPCALVVGQAEHHLPSFNVIAYLQASSSHESALKQLCDRVKTMFPHHFRTKQLIITGDASGKQRDASRPSNINRYTDICGFLQTGRQAVRIARANSTHKFSRDMCNDLCHLLGPAFQFYGGQGCEMLIDEIESAYPDEKESLNKAKKELGLHGLDAWRYLIHYWMVLEPRLSDAKQYKQHVIGLSNRLKNK